MDENTPSILTYVSPCAYVKLVEFYSVETRCQAEKKIGKCYFNQKVSNELTKHLH